MGIPSPVEELAWLVKDNLYAKHLVLSVEELFVEFLECPLSEEETLTLEPMVSYQRMLLHRLADLFGLAHESVGEGDDRHLVVEKCDESLIPALLVSDVLENGDGETQHPLFSRQLLKRSTPPADGFQTPPKLDSPFLSLEERQAAYLAARQRIFSETWKYSEETSKETGSVRRKSDPVVARRMIAHALGKPKITSPSPGLRPASDLELQALAGEVTDRSWIDRDANEKKDLSEEARDSLQTSSVKAAKRMFANALGLPPVGGSPRVAPRQVLCNLGTCSIPSQPEQNIMSNINAPRCKNLTALSAEGAYQDPCNIGRRPSIRSNRATRHSGPGGAARRIFAQALGLPDPAYASEVNRPASMQ